MQLNHKHILVTARGLKNPPTDPEQVKNWLTRLVAAVNMKVLLGPYATYCEEPDNEGVTGIICLVTSHASIHVWHKAVEPFLKLDLYSCDDFESATVLNLLKEFEPSYTEHMVIDRNDAGYADQRHRRVIETGVAYNNPPEIIAHPATHKNDPKSHYSCVFCGKNDNEVKWLVVSSKSDAGICERCVEISSKSISEAISKNHSK